MSVGSWRVAVRIAARTALRSPGRTLLVGAMVALPVAGLAAADTLWRTAQLTPSQQVERSVGAADYIVTDDANASYLVFRTGEAPGGRAIDRPRVRTEGLGSLRRAGAELVPHMIGGLEFETTNGTNLTNLRVTDLSSPLVDGSVARRSGDAPSGPDEVVVSPRFLVDAEVAVGDTVVLTGAPPGPGAVGPSQKVLIVGTAVDPNAANDPVVFAPPNSVLRSLSPDSLSRAWLVGAPASMSDSDFADVVARSGLVHADRAMLEQQVVELARQSPDRADAIGTGVVVVGLAGLQIVLLASAAFAVGARRQRRDLGLVAAQGGDRRHVRSVVLASALVIGAAASIVGVSLGVAVAAIARTPIESATSDLFGPFEVAPVDLAVLVAVGLATALVAAALPARTASRVPVLAALTGRRGQTRVPHWLTVVALIGVAAGFVVAANGARPPARYNVILFGAVIAELGFAMCAPALVGLAGRLARWFPLTLRLAFRDSARNRGRSAPAVAAVMAALAATVALSIFMVSSDQRDRDLYVASQPTTLLTGYGQGERTFDDAAWRGAAAAAAAVLPGGRAVELRILGEQGADAMTNVSTELAAPRVDANGSSWFGTIAVGDAETIRALTGVTPDDTVASALADGRAVVLGLAAGEQINVMVERFSDVEGGGFEEGEQQVSKVRLPATRMDARPYPNLPLAVVSPETAETLGTGTQVIQGMWTADEPITAGQLADAADALRAAGITGIELTREAGYQSELGVLLLALIAVSAVVTLGATAIATGLASAEARPDLATLAAVGASPRVRRLLSMSQAASIAVTGAVLGVLAGIVPAFAILQAREDYPFVVPWEILTVVVVGVPATAALLAGVFTRSRLPMKARIE